MEKLYDKTSLRKYLKQTVLSLDKKEEKSLSVTEKAVGLCSSLNIESAAVFLSINVEPDTSLLIDYLLKKCSVYAPVISDTSMEFFQITDKTKYNKNKYGIPEPDKGESKTDFDIIFVPLLGYDSKLNRLGKGKGYYDRFLKNSSAFKVGLAFSCQLAETVFETETDVPLDCIVNEKEIIYKP